MISKQLIEKYNRAVPRYTSYPPANFFHSEFNEEQKLSLLEASNTLHPEAISLYFHVPFCPQLCHFCGCNSTKLPDKSTTDAYFRAMEKELLMLKERLDNRRKVRQVHWGGGTPNGVSIHYLQRMMELVRQHFHLAHDAEVAIEAHPAYISQKQLNVLKAAGFTRISLGIQDLHPGVLEAIGRRSSKIPVEELIPQIRAAGFDSVNIDLVYGLPGQLRENYLETVEQILALRPNRIVSFSYAHVPWVKGNQKKIENVQRLEGEEKLALFIRGKTMLEEGGYQSLGLDHFALPEDPLSRAFRNRELHRNFMGYALKEQTGQVYALGASGISQMSNGYLQNEKDYRKYMELIHKEKHAYTKGYESNDKERKAGKIIMQIMCNGSLDIHRMSKELNISEEEARRFFTSTAVKEQLSSMEKDGLMHCNESGFELTGQGWFFVRNVASLFDPKLKKTSGMYSKSI